MVASAFLIIWILVSDNPYQLGEVGYNRLLVGVIPMIAWFLYVIPSTAKFKLKFVFTLILAPVLIGIHQVIITPVLINMSFGEPFHLWHHPQRIGANFILYGLPAIGFILFFEGYLKRQKKLAAIKKQIKMR